MSTPSPLPMAVVEAIALARGVAPLDLTLCLYDWVDADVLDALAGMSNETWTFEFAVEHHRIAVSGDGSITVDGRDPAELSASQPT